MRRIPKETTSAIYQENLKYKVNGNNSRLRDLLFDEQKGICAYTEKYMDRTDKKEIEHFNPSLKGQSNDGYHNYYLVKGQWNSEKSNKWTEYQPILYPYAEDFEERITYFEGDYSVAENNDIQAQNIFDLLNIGDPDLADMRKRYITRRKEEIEIRGISADLYFRELLDSERENVHYIRAIQEEFDITINL